MEIIQVDAFTRQPFHGNPAAVCVLPQFPPESLMQALAAEMNLSETVFVVPREQGDLDIRWFTPAAEVDLCGHATLAAAHVLWTEHGRVGQLRFHSRSGLLTADRSGSWITLNFPATPPAECSAPDGLLEALGLDQVEYVGRSAFDYLVVVSEEDTLRHLAPDLSKLKLVKARGVIVSSLCKGEDDFVSRFFAPAVGVNEDPVTGSAHCVLACYWSGRLGKSSLQAYQASSRGGHLQVVHRDDRVELSGEAITVFKAVWAHELTFP